MNRSLFRIVCLSAVLLAALAAAAPAGASSRIVGGDKVSDADFAARYGAVVSVQRRVKSGTYLDRYGDRLRHVCGGTLIAPRLVLTAAHCVDGGGFGFDAAGYEVLVGHSTLAARTVTTTGRVVVDSVFVHPEWKTTGPNYGIFGYYYFGGVAGAFQPENSEYDIAVLRLASPVTSVAPTPIVSAAEDAATWGAGGGRSSGAVALGWGGTSANFSIGRTGMPLRVVDLPIHADQRCERSDGGLDLQSLYFDADTQLCAGTVDPIADGNTARTTCYGDGGGPLLAPLADGSLRVVGVAGAAGTSRCRGWAVFARVAALRDWISSIPGDAGGPGGLVAPTNVTSTPTGVDRVRVSWTPSASGSPVQYIVYRGLPSGIARALVGPYSVGTPFVVGGVTDGSATSIEVQGIAPRRAGSNATRVIRVDARDASGNRVEGDEVRITPPTDSAAPSRPGARFVVRGRRFGGPRLNFRRSVDNDCVADYRIQMSRDGEHWRTTSTEHRYDCEGDLFTRWYFGSPRDGGDILVQRIGFVRRAGHYFIRVVAVDRAGNSTASRALAVHLGIDPDHRRVNTLLS